MRSVQISKVGGPQGPPHLAATPRRRGPSEEKRLHITLLLGTSINYDHHRCFSLESVANCNIHQEATRFIENCFMLLR